jgi:hypothetical protein
VNAAQKLPFIHRSDGGNATPKEIAADFEAVRKLFRPGAPPKQQLSANAQKPYTKLDLRDNDVTGLMTKAMSALSSCLPAMFPADWIWFPCEAKMGLLSMIYGLGPGGLAGNKAKKIKGYPALMNAARAFDWRTVAQQCHMGNVSDDRNNWTRMLFSQAYGMQLMFGDMGRMLKGDYKPRRFAGFGPLRFGEQGNQPPRRFYLSVVQGFQ